MIRHGWSTVPRRGSPADTPLAGQHERPRRRRARLPLGTVTALVAFFALGPVLAYAPFSSALASANRPAAAAASTQAAAETALSESGWTASSNTNSAAADAPANAIDGNSSTRFSSDAVAASGMWFQANMGSAQTFNQIEMDSGNWPGDYARGYNVEVSSDGSTFTTVASGTGTSLPETVTFSAQTAQYIRVVLTAPSPSSWWSIDQFTVFSNGSGGGGGGGTPPPTGGSLGSNVYVFTPSESQSTIQSTLNTIYDNQVSNQFGTQRYALLFEPGTYGSSSSPLNFSVGYYEQIAGLGQNPGAVTINGAINTFNQCQGSGYSNCNATDNSWRSISNLTINVMVTPAATPVTISGPPPRLRRCAGCTSTATSR